MPTKKIRLRIVPNTTYQLAYEIKPDAKLKSIIYSSHITFSATSDNAAKKIAQRLIEALPVSIPPDTAIHLMRLADRIGFKKTKTARRW